MAKYYAVKVGNTTGIFDNWEECKASVNGFPGALYKSFTNISEAYNYMGWEMKQMSLFDLEEDNVSPTGSTAITLKEEGMPYSDNKHAIAYVDGSFNSATGVFGYGVVMFYDGEEIHLSGMGDDEELAAMRNVAGEIAGSMEAIRFSLEKGCHEVIIYHDYEGIAKWPLGLWKTNKKGTKDYKAYYDKSKNSIKILFEKVKGHSGDKYNDLADALAKKACGVE
ncbi:MAG: RNase H [Lachnospiraceae bacterium]|nr:RNase H [Lachnospiraceae bacterium]